MASIPFASKSVRRLGRAFTRALSCWQIALAFVVLTSPCAGFLEGLEVVELTESSTPVEERGECAEFLVVTGATSTRRALERTTYESGLKRGSKCLTRLRVSRLRPGWFVSEHRLANGLRAPLLC